MEEAKGKTVFSTWARKLSFAMIAMPSAKLPSQHPLLRHILGKETMGNHWERLTCAALTSCSTPHLGWKVRNVALF